MKHPIQLRQTAFTLMEILVVIAIILVLAAILVPVVNSVRTTAQRNVAVNNLRQIASGAYNWAGQNDGVLPDEGPSTVDWQIAADPGSTKAWWNAVPRLLGSKGVGDYVHTPIEYYTKENMLWLPGAKYPGGGKELREPLFAIAINTKLQRRDDEGRKAPLRASTISNPARTVLFYENGLKGEKKAHPTQTKYTGAPKGGAKEFVARYNDQGVLAFVDGHAEVVSGKDLLTDTGRYPYEVGVVPDPIWCRTPEEDPNQKP